MRTLGLAAITLATLTATVVDGRAGQFAVAADAGREDSLRWIGSHARFMEDLERYNVRPQADRALAQPQRATRQDYLQFIDTQSPYGILAIVRNPNRGVYGYRHAFPALAQYDADPQPGYAEAIKASLRHYGQAVRERHRENPHSITFAATMWTPWLLRLHRDAFRKHGAWDDADETWLRDLLVFMARRLHVWGGPEHYWRGPMHRSTGEAMTKRLVATLYPDIPEAERWLAYADLQRQDWWAYRDNPINDINYFHCQAIPMAFGSHILGLEEVFTDPGMKPFWDRLIHLTSPDGAVAPFGPAWGWNSHAGERMALLELAALHTGDGRYRFVAHRILQQLRYQKEIITRNHMLDHFNELGAAVAYFLADDSVEPVTPDPGSQVLYHKETLRVRGKDAARDWLNDLSPDPVEAHVCCNLICTDRDMPFKLSLRSGWDPGDFYMLVDLFPRHEPMNVGGILTLTRWNSVATHAIATKDVTDWMNMFKVDDLSGTAPVVANDDPRTRDAYYQEVDIAAFADHALATYAAINVADFNGFSMTLKREFFFIKNRFAVVRDTATFREGFLARIGPVWWTQNVGPQVGPHWANTYMSGGMAFDLRHKNPPVDLMVYHAPRPNRTLLIEDSTGDARRRPVPYTLRYAEDLTLVAGQPVTFAHLLMPLVPSREPVRSTERRAASVRENGAGYMAGSTQVMADNTNLSVWRLAAEEDREEWVFFNDDGRPLDFAPLATDARRAYVDLRNGRVERALILDGSYLTNDGQDVFREADRTHHEIR